MREIKFRAWDKKRKEWCDWFAVENDGNIIKPDNSKEQDIQGYSDTKDLILMQFTGLKDKNGKEIYEGDILECNSSDDEWTDTIVFKDAQFTLSRDHKDTKHIYPDLMEVLDDCKVIGNIHENPELLEAKGED